MGRTPFILLRGYVSTSTQGEVVERPFLFACLCLRSSLYSTEMFSLRKRIFKYINAFLIETGYLQKGGNPKVKYHGSITAKRI